MDQRRKARAETAVMHRARRGLQEFALMTLLFLFYFATRGIAAGKEAVAFANAHEVMDLERRLGLFHEMWLQAGILAEPLAVRFFNFIYTYTHMTGLIIFAVWVFFFHPARYREIRNIFLTVLGFGLLTYVLFPLAPPRFFPYTGFVDTLALYSGVNYDQPSLAMLYNPFAAMPSLHVAFALFTGIGLIRIGTEKIHWVLGILYPALMITAVVGTGNHFILDAIAGSFLTVMAYIFVPRVMAFIGGYRQHQREAVGTISR